MATTEFGDRSVPMARMEALASQLRLLKSGMADMQDRLDALLIEFGSELQPLQAESAPASDLPPERQAESSNAQEIADTACEPAAAEAPPEIEIVTSEEQADIEPSTAAETEQPAPAAEEPIVLLAIEEPAVVAVETPIVATQVSDAPAEATEPTIAASIATIEPIAAAETELLTLADAPVAQAIEAPIVLQVVDQVAAAPLSRNVVVLAERRATPRNGRVAVVRAVRWAAAIVLIAMAAAATATGTGFAGNGELVIVKRVCAIAGEACSIMQGTP